MNIITKFSLLDEPLADGKIVRVLLVETENPTLRKSLDGDEHPLDWTGIRRVVSEKVGDYRARGETINRVRVVGVRDGGHVTEWDV
jgi:hypothetical protein